LLAQTVGPPLPEAVSGTNFMDPREANVAFGLGPTARPTPSQCHTTPSPPISSPIARLAYAKAAAEAGDLSAAAEMFEQALEDGLFAFSVETGEGDGFALGPQMRFAHARTYVEAAAARAGLHPLVVQPASVRREAGAETAGLICVFERTERRACG
jgi:hypothetical protein